MNLFFKSYRRYLIISFLITWLSAVNIANAQTRTVLLTPWIQEVGVSTPSGDIAHASLYIDGQGHLFLGQENGLTIKVQNRHLRLFMKGPVFVTGNQSDTLIYTTPGDVGLLLPDRENGYRPLSRAYWIPASQREFTPTGIVKYGEVIFIPSEKGVYSIRRGVCQLHEPASSPRFIRNQNDTVFLWLANNETWFWNGAGFEKHRDSGRGTGALNTIGTERSQDRKPVAAYPLRDGFMLVQDSLEGLLIMDRNGLVRSRLGMKVGLPDREIRQITVRDGHEIWILAPHTLHRLSYPSPLSILRFDNFQEGMVLNSLPAGDTLYIGTTGGLWELSRERTGPDMAGIRNLLPGVHESIHLLARAGDRLFAAGITHLYVIENDRFESLGEGSFTGLAALDRDRVLAANRQGIAIWQKRQNTGWTMKPVDATLAAATSFTTHGSHVYFLCNDGVYRLNEMQDGAEAIAFRPGEVPYRLIGLGKDLYMVSDERVYLLDTGRNVFNPLPDGRMAAILGNSDDIAPMPDESLWQVRHRGKYRSELILIRDWDDPDEEILLIPVAGNLGEIKQLAFRDSTLVITGKDKVSWLDLSLLKNQPLTDRVRLEDLQIEGDQAAIYLGGLELQSTPEPLFRFRLSPSQGEWSAWKTERSPVFRNLRHGPHILEAQAMDLYGRTTPVAAVTFEIPVPVYLKWYALMVYAFLLMVLLFLFRKWRMLSYQQAESRISKRLQEKIDQMAIEKAKADKLAAEFLPEKTMEELKASGRSKWQKYERATVLFSDIQGFTRIAEEMNPESLIDELDKFFFHFDSVVEKYNIEKIKTIGDAYMAAGGIPEKNSTNPVEVVLAAVEMQAYMAQLKASRANIWDLRIGIHTGPVIAGVVGQKKVSYDIWGDTVNTASRMESSGLPGKVNISGITYGMVKEYFICEYRGRLPVKYKGNIDMYFVRGLRPELSVDLKAIPNKRFFTKLQLLRLADVEEKVFGEILEDLSAPLHFHSQEHARKVYDQAFMLCRAEEVEQEERLLVRSAALMLFTGLKQSYTNFENHSVEITRDLLPHYQYSETQIDRVCNLILSTKFPFHPNNHLEKILIDARMEFLGRPDYTSRIKLLFQELREAGTKINGQQFKHQQIELLHDFEYFTVAARRLREVSSRQQMTRLEKERWI